MAEGKVATYAINLEGNAATKAAADADALVRLKEQIQASQGAIKGLSQSYRSLRGSSDEVAKAKEQLKAKMEAEKGAISKATLELLGHGKTLQQVTAETKKAAGGAAELGEGMGAMLNPIVAVTAGLVAATAVVAGLTYEIGKFVIESANSLRAMNLTREAASGSAEDAAALGTQVDDLSHKVATSKAELNKLGAAIVQNLSGGLSRASGQAIEDTFYAVAQASAAMGDQVGGTLRGLVERGKQWNRFSLSPQDLQGTQLQFKEVSEALAKNLNIGIDDARMALFNGRVTLEAGAKALRDAVEKRFGEVNAKRLIDLDVQIAKLKEHFTALASGVVPLLDPLLEGLNKLLMLFDDSTASGQILQGIFTYIGQTILRHRARRLRESQDRDRGSGGCGARPLALAQGDQ